MNSESSVAFFRNPLRSGNKFVDSLEIGLHNHVERPRTELVFRIIATLMGHQEARPGRSLFSFQLQAARHVLAPDSLLARTLLTAH